MNEPETKTQAYIFFIQHETLLLETLYKMLQKDTEHGMEEMMSFIEFNKKMLNGVNNKEA